MKAITWFTYLALTQPRVAAALEVLVVGTGIFVLAWTGSLLLRGAPAAVRHMVWAVAIAASLTVPLMEWNSLVGGGLVAGATWSPGPAGSPNGIAAAALAVWAGGAVILVLRAWVGWLAVRGIVARAEWPCPVKPGSTTTSGSETPTYLISEEVSTPFTVGLLRPRIVLPREVSASGREELEAVLTHERAHVRRRDVLVSYMGLLARAFYWPIPLAWTALRRLREESESACDAAVLAAGVNKTVYARQLARFAAAGPSRVWAGAPALGSHAFRRIQALCGDNPPRMAGKPTLALALALSLAVAGRRSSAGTALRRSGLRQRRRDRVAVIGDSTPAVTPGRRAEGPPSRLRSRPSKLTAGVTPGLRLTTYAGTWDRYRLPWRST